MNIEQIKKEIKKIQLTAEEKEIMLNNILKSPRPSPYTPIPSWWKTTSLRPMQYVALSLLILIASGGGMSYAALNTLPGDTLYPVKVGLTEPILDILTFTPESKAKWEAEKAIRRLNEASKLAERNGLDVERKNEIEKRLDKNVEKFNKIIEKTENKKSSKDSEKLKTNFENSLIKRQEEIQKNRENKKEENEQEKEVQILEKKVRTKIFLGRDPTKENKNIDEKDTNKQINIQNINID